MYRATKRRKELVKQFRLLPKQFKYKNYIIQTEFIVINGKWVLNTEIPNIFKGM